MIKNNLNININEIINKKCAPSKKYIDGSCIPLHKLKKIAKKYNDDNDDKIDTSLSKKLIVKELEDKFSNNCSNHACWLRLDIIKNLNDEDISNNSIRPDGPNKKYDWLSTTHINDVIEQYHYLYKEFNFLGAVPYDFEDLSILGIKNLNFKKLKNNNKTKIGMVINLDKHNQNGSHWVSLYTDLKKNQIYFFDSVGKQPYKRIRKFINKIAKYLYYKIFNDNLPINNVLQQIKEYNKLSYKNIDINENKYLFNLLNELDIRYNDIQHQFKNSECGVYCINFITRLLDGETFDTIINNITKDDEMNQMRNTYFYNFNF